MKTLLRAFVVATLTVVAQTRAAEPAPGFNLKRFGDDTRVRLDDYAGRIVVLDFFAHWCAPCARSTPVVEAQIQKYYEERKGNAHGVPVQVISVNVEPAEAKATAAFIRKHGPSLVVNDVEGATLAAFKGAGLPYFVILDGTGPAAADGKPVFTIVYARAGFDGAEKLRAIIDRLGARRP